MIFSRPLDVSTLNLAYIIKKIFVPILYALLMEHDPLFQKIRFIVSKLV